MDRDQPGYFEGERDPGNLRYYARMKEYRERLNAILLPAGGRVTYVGMSVGSLTAIWYFGKAETGFAGGRSFEALLESIYGHIFGGL